MKKRIKKILNKLFWGYLQPVLSDKWYARIRYWLKFDWLLNLKNPQKFTEKIQWIKLYERTPLRQTAANRLAVRNYVANRIGKKHLIPLISSFESLTESIWESLPNQFILKANHGCGMLKIVRNKQQENFDQTLKQTEEWKQTDYFKLGREWAYKGLPRTILAEKLLLDANENIPKDYKFFCFNGTVKLIQVDYNRFGDQKRNLFNRDFKRIDGTLRFPPYSGSVTKPAQLDQAITMAETLGAEFSFIRVDLYLMQDNIYFGELTNYPGNGFVRFYPEELEYKYGSYITL